MTYVSNPYECPSLVKLGNYSELSSSEKKMDILISKLTGGKVYPEVLAEIQPTIKSFGYDIQLEAMSLLKKQVD